MNDLTDTLVRDLYKLAHSCENGLRGDPRLSEGRQFMFSIHTGWDEDPKGLLRASARMIKLQQQDINKLRGK